MTWKISGKLPLAEITYVAKDGQEYPIDLQQVFKIVMLCTLLGLAFLMGSWIQLSALEAAARMCQNLDLLKLPI